MIGLDTNILVRYLAQDDPIQSRKATTFIEKAISHHTLFINQIVLCELTWVLLRAYHQPKVNVVQILENILLTQQFEVEDRNSVWAALSSFKNSKADFADCLIGVKNQMAGCKKTLTFDQLAQNLEGFEIVA